MAQSGRKGYMTPAVWGVPNAQLRDKIRIGWVFLEKKGGGFGTHKACDRYLPAKTQTFIVVFDATQAILP